VTQSPRRPKQYSFHHHKHANYERVLVAFRKEYLAKGEPDFLAVPYVLMCATTLEARLNDELYGFASNTWGNNFKLIAEAFLSMSFRGKLIALVPILTNQRYRINQEHFVYQRLASLITFRNLLAHPKPTIYSFESPELGENQLWPFPYPQTPKQIIDKLSDLTMGATKAFTPLEYHEALEKLENWFLQRCPDRLSKIAMVVKR
jgi:hypothetical protein